MRLTSSDDTGRAGVHGVALLIVRELKWKFREQNESDIGIDAQVEIVEQGRATGRLLALQIKAGRSWFREQATAPRGWVFRGSLRHLEYWLGHDLPVLIVLYDEENQVAYWQHVTREAATLTGERFKLIVPASNRLDQAAMQPLREVSVTTRTNLYERALVANSQSVTGLGHGRPGPGRSSRPDANDAVIIVPGFGGSELVDTETGAVVWGLTNPSWYVKAWTSGTALEVLKVTEAEREGRLRLAAPRLLRAPGFIPGLRGVEPYSRLVSGVRAMAAHPDAVLEFPYDWRLGVARNAAFLTAAADAHLARWRKHSHGSNQAELVLVAHSVGGLVAQYFTAILDGREIVRSTIALGVPFYGTVAAVRMVSGRRPPVMLPRKKAIGLFRTMPGIYDMLPTYRCVDEGNSARRLTVADVASLGGDAELASEAFHLHRQIHEIDGSPLTTIVGAGQPTAQSLQIVDGEIVSRGYFCDTDSTGALRRVDLRGDGIVFPDAATRHGANLVYVPQTHGSLPGCAEVLMTIQQEAFSTPVELHL